MRGGAGHHGDARGERPHAVGDLIGAPVEHADVIERSAQRVGADLGERGLHALADRGDPGDHLDPAARVDGDAHAVERAEPALLDEHAEAEPDQLPCPPAFGQRRFELVVTQVVEHALQQPG